MTVYRCHFDFELVLDCKVDSDKGIDEFAGGFWVNSKIKFTKGNDAKFWIPPSKIVFIEKITLN